MAFIYSIVFFIQAVCTPGAHRINQKAVPRIPAIKEQVAILDPVVAESSGLAYVRENKEYFLTINDSGSKPQVFAVSTEGKVMHTYDIPDALNVDWEEVSYYKDTLGQMHLLIGDIGNNANHRVDLCMYDYSVQSHSTSTHFFQYEDQLQIPPDKNQMNYDCEAFFKRNSSYYFISKNRSKGPVKVYKLAKDTSMHQAKIIQQLYFKGMVTACSMFVDAVSKEERLAVLVYGRMLLFNILKTTDSIELKPIGRIAFPFYGQTEGLTWLSEKEWMLTNEKGKMFRIRMKN